MPLMLLLYLQTFASFYHGRSNSDIADSDPPKNTGDVLKELLYNNTSSETQLGFTVGSSVDLGRALKSGLSIGEAGRFKVKTIEGILELRNKVSQYTK